MKIFVNILKPKEIGESQNSLKQLIPDFNTNVPHLRELQEFYIFLYMYACSKSIDLGISLGSQS